VLLYVKIVGTFETKTLFIIKDTTNMIDKLFTLKQIEYIESLNYDRKKSLKEKLTLLYDYIYEAIQTADELEN
jgi:flagellin-specific chaperone FliS